ncbi:MAG: FAD-binding protein, partial [Candidatus Cloacimonetes bacterium]|nr:FAD-binding protein [Candidatus Cloacimonadota bacterium]
MQKLATTELANLLEKDALRFAEPMSLHTSFQIGGPADIYTLPSSQAELMQILKFCYTHAIPWMIVGRGSNLLVSDKGIRGMVIATDLYNKISIDENYVSAFCGTSLEDLCNFCMENGVAGLEFASGIPGSVGGAVFMNAGAYGGEIKDILY